MKRRAVPLALGLALVAFMTTSSPAGANVRTGEAPPVDPVLRAFRVNLEEPVSLTPEQRRVAEAAGHRMISLCPHCRLGTLEEDGPCGWARTHRLIIRAAAAGGFDEETIVRTYIDAYGPRILAPSKQQGFAAASWAVPVGATLLGLISVFAAGQRMRRPRPPGEPEARAHPPEPTDEDTRRLERALAELDP